jgi:hypothetical protein
MFHKPGSGARFLLGAAGCRRGIRGGLKTCVGTRLWGRKVFFRIKKSLDIFLSAGVYRKVNSSTHRMDQE